MMQDDMTIVMQSANNVFLRIDASTIPEKKKGAAGVRGIKLDAKDVLTNIYCLAPGDNVNVKVKGKAIALNRLHIGNRDTKGVKK
jgi:DNA gyrase subunit A